MVNRHGNAFQLLALLSVLIFGSQSAEAAQVRWRKNFDKAAQEASRTSKPMLVEFTADWCTYCHKMRRSFENEQLAQHVESCFVPVTVDADRDEKLVESVGVESLPTTLIISPDMKVLKRITGYKSAQQLTAALSEICTPDGAIQPATAVNHRAQTQPAAYIESPAGLQFAFDRCCLVSLVESQKFVVGSPEYAVAYRGLTVCFASPEHLAKFQQNPEKYWPLLNGGCPIGFLEEGKLYAGSPKWGAIYLNQLWLFSSGERRQKFAENPEAVVSQLLGPKAQ